MLGASSRPFLNMLNPMGRTYQGYMQMGQSVLEEQEEDEDARYEDDVESQAGGSMLKSAMGKSKRVAWGKGVSGGRGDASEMSTLRPNIRRDDKIHENESSDDDVSPQDFMIETAHKPSTSPRQPPPNERRRPLYTNSKPPNTKPTSILPTVSIPPRPSEIETRETSPSRPLEDHQPKQMRGLDAYERALWNWVNVYNLDAFLQEVYYYYEGKGIYSIALSRGLNLVLVIIVNLSHSVPPTNFTVSRTVGFVIGFSTFLLGCIDYSRIRPDHTTRLSDVVVSRCVSKFSGFTFLFFILFTAFFVWQIVTFVLSIVRLVDMYRFYTYLLRIPDVSPSTPLPPNESNISYLLG